MTIKFIEDPLKTIQYPFITFSELAYFKILSIISSKIPNGNEVMWLGIVDKKSNNKFFIEDILIPPQTKNSPAYVETDDKHFPEWITQFNVNQRKQIRFHGHLHPKMSPNPSSTDENLFIQLLNTVSDFYIRFIINSSGAFQLDLFDKEQNLIFTDCSLYIKLTNELAIHVTPKGYATLQYAETFTIKDKSMEFKNNELHFTLSENPKIRLVRGLLSNDFFIESNYLTLSDGSLDINKHDLAEKIDLQLDQAIAKPTITYGYGYEYANNKIEKKSGKSKKGKHSSHCQKDIFEDVLACRYNPITQSWEDIE